MKIYMYKADLYCEKCTSLIKDELKEKWQRATSLDSRPNIPVDETNESSYDSDDWPKGPIYEASDYPQHCGECNLFLENPLTAEGEEYVRKEIALSNYILVDPNIIAIWREHYSYLF
jgi:hypothetical protein